MTFLWLLLLAGDLCVRRVDCWDCLIDGSDCEFLETFESEASVLEDLAFTFLLII